MKHVKTVLDDIYSFLEVFMCTGEYDYLSNATAMCEELNLLYPYLRCGATNILLKIIQGALQLRQKRIREAAM